MSIVNIMTELKARKISKILDMLIPVDPSQKTSTTAFKMLVATILSAQSTGKQTRKAADTLFAIADTPDKMIRLGELDIQDLIKTVGLFRNKAKAIYKTSQMLIDKYSGIVPGDLKALCELPGVGLKTASILLQFYFGQAAMPVDTHIFRCARRWGLSDRNTADGVSHDLQKLYPKTMWGKIHMQIVRFGRQYCPARNHDFSKCPVCSWAHEIG